MYGPTPPVPPSVPPSSAYPEPGPYAAGAPGSHHGGQPTAYIGPFAGAGYLVGPAAPPRRSTARRVGLVALRTVLACVPLGTIGILSFVPLVRTALVRRRAWDWVALIVTAVAAFWALAAVGTSTNDDSLQCEAGMGTLFLLAMGSTVYFLVAELRTPPPARFAPQDFAPRDFAPHGFAHPQFAAARFADPHGTPAQYPASPWPTARTAPPLVPLGQVQAELDELSALLHGHERPST
jgi:hypothetical protein